MSAASTSPAFTLPPSIVTKTDISRLVTEFERVDNELTAVSVRAKTGAQPAAQPVLSEQLTAFMAQNKLTIGTSQERSELIKQLRSLKDHAPILHMTFAVEADRASLQQLAQWVRGSIHPQAVLAVGLQPGLVAGVYLRTPNRVHDLSFRSALSSSRELLVQEIGALRGKK